MPSEPMSREEIRPPDATPAIRKGPVEAATPPVRLVPAEDEAPLPPVPPRSAVATPAAPEHEFRGRASRIGLGVAALAIAGYFVWDRFFALGSTNAVLSATPLMVRAPIEGEVRLEPIAPGTLLEPRTTLGAVRNSRPDRTRVNDLTAQPGPAGGAGPQPPGPHPRAVR